MKNIILYLLLVIAIPAVAQPGHHSVRPRPSHHARPKPHHEELGMNPRDYEEAVRIINKENFDEKRLDVAKRIVSINTLSTRQIVGICKLFTFEANRLEFAKFAYFHCADPNNYFMVDEVFTFRSSKEELFKFIRHHR